MNLCVVGMVYEQKEAHCVPALTMGDEPGMPAEGAPRGCSPLVDKTLGLLEVAMWLTLKKLRCLQTAGVARKELRGIGRNGYA